MQVPTSPARAMGKEETDDEGNGGVFDAPENV